MKLLLFLSALLTGLTGAMSGGQRPEVAAVQRSVAQGVDIASEVMAGVALPSRFAAPLSLSPFMSLFAIPAQMATSGAAVNLPRVNEKRLI